MISLRGVVVRPAAANAVCSEGGNRLAAGSAAGITARRRPPAGLQASEHGTLIFKEDQPLRPRAAGRPVTLQAISGFACQVTLRNLESK